MPGLGSCGTREPQAPGRRGREGAGWCRNRSPSPRLGRALVWGPLSAPLTSCALPRTRVPPQAAGPGRGWSAAPSSVPGAGEVVTLPGKVRGARRRAPGEGPGRKPREWATWRSGGGRPRRLRGLGQSRGTRSQFSPEAARESPPRGGVCVCAHVCLCPRVSVCVCKGDKRVHLPQGRCEGTSRFPSVRGGDRVPDSWKLNWKDGEGRPQLAARSLSPNCCFFFSFFLFSSSFLSFFSRLVAHAISRCRLCTGMLCGPEYPVPWLPQPRKAREPWRPRDREPGQTSFMLMNAHWGRIDREGAGVG